MEHILGKSNFRVQHVVNNIAAAERVVIVGNDHHISFPIEYWNNYTKQMVKSRIIYVIDTNLVNSLKQREKTVSK